MNARSATFVATVLGLCLSGSSASGAAPPTLSYFCQSSVMDSHTFYVTDVFTVTAQTSDVTNAWRAHIAGVDAKARQTALCQGGLDVPSLEDLRKLTTKSFVELELSVVDVAWSYAAPP